MKAVAYHKHRLARNRAGTWLAVAAMVFQVLFGTAHAASMAAAAFGPLVVEKSSALAFDLFQICSASGLIEIRTQIIDESGQQGKENTASDRCPVCSSACVSPAIAALAADVLPAPFIGVSVLLAPEQGAIVTRGNPRHLIRGPPLTQNI